MRLLLLGFVTSASLLTASCSIVYEQDIQQGNLLTQEIVDAVKPGMTKRQVSIVMGTPAIAHPFDQDRWDYLHAVSRRGGDPEVKNLTLYFENNLLARVEGDFTPRTGDDLLREQQRLDKGIPEEERATIPGVEKKPEKKSEEATQ